MESLNSVENNIGKKLDKKNSGCVLAEQNRIDHSEEKSCEKSTPVRKLSLLQFNFSPYVNEMKPNEYLEQFVIKSNNDLTKFKCSFCTYESDRKSNLKSHILTHVSLPPRFKCLECSFENDERHVIRRHIMDHLGKDGKRKCPVCDSRFQNENQLMYHLVKHKGILLKCRYCNFETESRHIYIKHLSLHTDNTVYSCNECKFESRILNQFLTHRLIHLNESKLYACKDCDYETNYRQCLHRHVLIHNNTKPFKCGLCPYTGYRKEYYKNHLLKHYSNTKLYNCVKCKYRTNWKHSLTRHLRKNH